MTSIDLKSNYVIIVAGGSGTRMQAAVPKQFLLLNGKPVLMHTMEAFYHSPVQPHIIAVLHTGFHTYWQQLCAVHNFTVPHLLVAGGPTRFHSVKNGLDTITDDSAIIAVHDGARPLTTAHIIQTSYQCAGKHESAVTAVKSRDSVRQLKNGRSVGLLRDEIYLVQTPQTFRASLLKKAYEQSFDTRFTDDASVVEQLGVEIYLTEGDYQNIKITHPEDLEIAGLLLTKKPLT